MNNRVIPGSHSIERPARGWSRVSQALLRQLWDEDDVKPGGIHIGYAHSDRACTYLRLRSDQTNPTTQIIELSGPILDVVRWCSKCTPRKPCAHAEDTNKSLVASSRLLESTLPAPHKLSVEDVADELVRLRRVAEQHNFKWQEIQRLANQLWMDEISERKES